MSEEIFCTSFTDVSNTISRMAQEGYNRESQPAQRVEHDGRVWTTEATFSKTIAGWDRFVSFLRTLFDKISFAIGLKELSEGEFQQLQKDWNLAWEGTSKFCIYADMMKKLNKSVYKYIAPTVPEQIISMNIRMNRAPAFIAVQDGFVIRLPHLMANQLQALRNKLEQASISFEERDIRQTVQHTLFTKEVFISTSQAAQLFAELPDLDLGEMTAESSQQLISSLGARTFTHHASTAAGRPEVSKAIALTLARIYPALDALIADTGMRPQNFSVALPHVEIDPLGIMSIKIPENHPLLCERIIEIYNLVPSDIEEHLSGYNYTTEFRVSRDNIAQFLDQLGLQAVPAAMHADYVDGRLTYFQSLINAGATHVYEPQLRSEPYHCLNESLAAVIPNIGQLVELNDGGVLFSPVTPYTAIHPKGWLSIRLPAMPIGSGNTYAENLKKYLKCKEFFPINYHVNGQHYDQELRIDKVQLPDFLKLMHLERNAEGERFIEKIGQNTAMRRFTPTFAIVPRAHRQEVNVFATIATTLQSFLPNHPESPLHVAITAEGLTIIVPEATHNQHIPISENEDLPFGEFLANAYALDGRINSHGGGYVLKVPAANIKSFIERDLSLRDMPENLRHDGKKTFYQALVSEYGPRFNAVEHRSGEIIGWNLRNPTISMPTAFTPLSDSEIVQRARALLEGHPRVARYCEVIEQTLGRKSGLDDGGAHMSSCLSLIVSPTPNLVQGGVTRERQRAALATIGATATECMPGRATKIEMEYQGMIVPQSRDQLRSMLLGEIEQYKMGLLGVTLRAQGDFGTFDVHNVASAQIAWGEELGLDAAAGARDRYAREAIVTREQKERFKQTCQEHMVQTLFEQLSSRRDEVEPEKLEYAELYMERINAILPKLGYTLEEIDGAVLDDNDDDMVEPAPGLRNRLLPSDNDSNIRLTKEALELILADIGVLYV